MQKLMSRWFILSLLTAALVSLALPVAAADASPNTEAVQQEKKASKVAPFQGKISAVDTSANTLTLAGKVKNRTITLTSETKITKNGQPATLGDATVGDVVGGRAKLTAEGHFEALSLRIGPKPEGTAPAPKKKAKKE
jgi:hypothetical protein